MLPTSNFFVLVISNVCNFKTPKNQGTNFNNWTKNKFSGLKLDVNVFILRRIFAYDEVSTEAVFFGRANIH